MKYEIGTAWAILKGKKSGNKEDALRMLNSRSPGNYKEANRQQGRIRARLHKKAYRIGDTPEKRWAV